MPTITAAIRRTARTTATITTIAVRSRHATTRILTTITTTAAKSSPRHHQRGELLALGHRGDRVPDYRKHGLKAPPRGHEWRRVDHQYALIAVATGVISSSIATSR